MYKLNKEYFKNRFSDMRNLVCLVMVVTFSIVVVASAIGTEAVKTASATGARNLPEGKQTTLALYVTATEAYEMWRAAPEKITVIDVRTPEEYAFIGHPEMALNIPVAFVTYQRKNGITEYGPKMNPDFVTEVKQLAKPTDTLLLMCRSGGRSAKAVNHLAAAGFVNAYNIIDGFEGDKVKDPVSVFFGKRMRNGWKNSAPWVYDIDPEKIILEEGASKQTEPK